MCVVIVFTHLRLYDGQTGFIWFYLLSFVFNVPVVFSASGQIMVI